jgi:signal transduction histidine kinase
LLLIVVFSLFVYYIIGQSIFFWYAFYLAFLGLYLLAHIGLFFQIGYPNQNWFNDYSRPIFVTLSTSALLHFIRLLLNIESLLPKWNIVYNIIISFLVVTTLYWVLTPWWRSAQTIVYLNSQNLALLLSFIVVLSTSILTFKKQKIVVLFFLVAFMAVLAAGMSIILVESGWVNESVMAISPLFFGSMIEAVVFAIGLAYWSRINDGERLKLVDMIHSSKKQLVDSYIQGVEEEKKQIASDLHDDIGSRLSHLKRQLERSPESSESLLRKLEDLGKRVRRISHELSPPSFQTDEFLISLRHLIFTHQAEELKINLQLFDLPNVLDRAISKQLYRIIQSSLSSIEKHAKATQVDVQIFHHNAELVLAIEDNGVGFNYNKDAPGITMKGVLSRVALINGTIEVSSSKRHGTSIMINVPVLNGQLIEKSQ